MVDVALLRPGRIDKAVYCGFPDENERQEMLAIYLRKADFKTKFETPSEHQTFLQALARKIENFSSADIKGLV